MNWAAKRKLINDKSRRNVVSNQLVLVVPREHPIEIEIKPGFDLSSVLGPTGRLAVGDHAHVPAGRYAKQALVKLGAWDFRGRAPARCNRPCTAGATGPSGHG